MNKMVIRGWNSAPGAPAGCDPDRDGDCGALPIRVFPPKALVVRGVPVQTCESAWEPTPAELAMLNAGGHVVLRICGWQVPVALYVEPAPADEGGAA